MTDMICNWAQKCTLRCLGRNAHTDGLNCDTGHCELDVHCVPVSNELPPEVTELVKACQFASRVMNDYGNATNWPRDMPMEYGEAINALRAAGAPFDKEPTG